MNLYQHHGIGTKKGYEPTDIQREKALSKGRGISEDRMDRNMSRLAKEQAKKEKANKENQND